MGSIQATNIGTEKLRKASAYAWEQKDLPEPLPFTVPNLFKTIGPGAILLAAAIGGGEWLAAPAFAVKFGPQFMWIATIAIALQLVINLEGLRYTLYTGEPIYGGFLRLAPGRAVWSAYYCFVALLSLGWPALAVPCAATLFASYAGRIAGNPETDTLYWVASLIILSAFFILSFGGSIERTLERASYLMIGFVFPFLLLVNIIFIPLSHWWTTLTGFFTITFISGEMDWALLGAVAATAGNGGIGNLIITNWARDKGFGMGGYVGAIPAAIGGRQVKISPVGKIFPVTDENLKRWRIWQRYVYFDQIGIWALLAFMGLFLNVNLATGVIPQGSELSGMAIGSYQAKYMAEKLWPGFWALTLLNGFWILFSTHLGNTDGLVRTLTDVIWISSGKIRDFSAAGIGRVYYFFLILLTVWSLFAIRLAQPLTLFKIMANVSGFILAVAGIQICLVNRRFLPAEIRCRWREGVLILAALFYSFFAIRLII